MDKENIIKKFRLLIELYPFKVDKFGLVSHPLFCSFADMDFEISQLVKITHKNMKKLIEQRLWFMQKSDDPFKIYNIINKPYKLIFLCETRDLLTKEEYSELLGIIWLRTEFPNQMPIPQLIKMFQEAIFDKLMDEENLIEYNKLPKTITIYRGIQHKAKIKALSWTLDFERAKWFADRFSRKGQIFKAEIDKNYVFMYSGLEQEVVINPNRLRKLEKIR